MEDDIRMENEDKIDCEVKVKENVVKYGELLDLSYTHASLPFHVRQESMIFIINYWDDIKKIMEE
jgi:hypothetical protein